MTRPLTADEIRAALRKFGVPFREISGWEQRSNGGTWGDVTGFMWHHTGDDAPDTADRGLIVNGHVGLSGPLANFGLNDDGVVDLISLGPANHAGGGDPRVLAAVKGETYVDYPPPSRYAHGETGSIIGNPLFYGVEVYYYKTLTIKANATMPLLAAAIIWALDQVDTKNKWTSKSAIGHKEWQRGKIDPALVDCSVLRRLTQAYLDGGSPTTERTDEDIMADITLTNPATKEAASLGTGLNSIWAYTFLVYKQLDAISAKIGAPVDVDEAAIAASLAPLIVQTIKTSAVDLSDADIALLAKAVADEQARRLAQ